MAEIPTDRGLAETIIQILKEMNVRSGEIAPLMGIQQKLGPDYRAADINSALAYMEQAGLIEAARPGFVKLTQAGYGPEPSGSEVMRSVLDAIGEYGIRPGEAVPVQGIVPKLMQQGFKGSEIGDAIDSLTADGLMELRGQTPFLTPLGFEAI